MGGRTTVNMHKHIYIYICMYKQRETKQNCGKIFALNQVLSFEYYTHGDGVTVAPAAVLFLLLELCTFQMQDNSSAWRACSFAYCSAGSPEAVAPHGH